MPPTLRERFASALGGAADTISRVAAAIKRPNVAPDVNLPGVPRWGSNPSNVNNKLSQSLRDAEAFFGRVSYDAGPAWTRFSSYPATDLTPEKITGAQKDAVAGYPLIWSEMIEQILSRDAHLGGIAQQRVDDVVKGSWRLIDSMHDPLATAVTNFCDEAVRGIDSVEDGMSWLLLGNAYGYNAVEIVWERKRVTFPGPKGEILGPIEVVVPRMLCAVHPKHFRFDLRTDEPYLWLGSDQVSLPFGKFVFYRGEGQHPITVRRGYMWPCSWLSMFKSIGWAGWAVFAEKFALPTPLIKYDGDVSQYREHKAIYEEILNNLGQGIGAIVPSENFSAENFMATSGGRAGDPHSALSDACDSAQSVRVLGATLTAKIGNVGSFSASTAHLEVKYAREEADARRLWSSLRSDLIRPLVSFNADAIVRALQEQGYGSVSADMVVRRMPRGYHRVPREVDPVQRGEIVSMAINEWGLKVGASKLFDEFDLPQPVSKEDVARGEPQIIASGGASIGSQQAAEGVNVPKPEVEGGPPAQMQLPSHVPSRQKERRAARKKQR